MTQQTERDALIESLRLHWIDQAQDAEADPEEQCCYLMGLAAADMIEAQAQRIVELDEVVAELEGCHTDQILRAIAAEEERDTLRAELDAIKVDGALWRAFTRLNSEPKTSAFGIPFVGFEFTSRQETVAWESAIQRGCNFADAFTTAIAAPVVPAKPAQDVNAELVDAADRVNLKYGHDENDAPSDWTEWKDLRTALANAKAAQQKG